MKKYMLFGSTLMILFTGLSFGAKAQEPVHHKINIINFHVQKEKSRVDISWATDQSTATNYFEVERSNDGKNFKTVAYVLGADPTKKDCDCYGSFDKIPTTTSQSFYRLKHVDSNGEVEFSEVKMLALK